MHESRRFTPSMTTAATRKLMTIAVVWKKQMTAHVCFVALFTLAVAAGCSGTDSTSGADSGVCDLSGTWELRVDRGPSCSGLPPALDRLIIDGAKITVESDSDKRFGPRYIAAGFSPINCTIHHEWQELESPHSHLEMELKVTGDTGTGSIKVFDLSCNPVEIFVADVTAVRKARR